MRCDGRSAQTSEVLRCQAVRPQEHTAVSASVTGGTGGSPLEHHERTSQLALFGRELWRPASLPGEDLGNYVSTHGQRMFGMFIGTRECVCKHLCM